MNDATTPLTAAKASAAAVSLSTLMVGDWQHHEFGHVRSWLSECTRAVHADRIAAAEDVLRRACGRGGKIDLVVLACARCGQFTSDDLHRLRQAAPLAGLVALLGTWCDGHRRRAGDLLPGVCEVPWHGWSSWAEANLRQFCEHRCVSWGLPATCTADERADFWSRVPIARRGGLIAIDSPDADRAEAIADCLRIAGFAAAWLPPTTGGLVQGAAAVVCDADDINDTVAARLHCLSDQFTPAPIVTLLGFPRAADVQRASQAGAACVVAKPFTLHEFLAQLDNVLAPSGAGGANASAA